MRYALGYLLLACFLVLVFLGDFYLSNRLKQAISDINRQSRDGFGVTPLSTWSFLLTTVLLWAPPFLLPGSLLRLEYRIMITIVYWVLLILGGRWLLQKKTSRAIAGRALPVLLVIGFVTGVLLTPAIIVIMG